MKKLSIFAFSLLSIFASSLSAKEYLLIGKRDGREYYIRSQEDATKIGKAYLGWIHWVSEDKVTSLRFLMDCGGSWISNPIEYGLSDNAKDKISGMSEVIKNSKDRFSSPVIINSWTESSWDFVEFIRPQLKRICSTARERKGIEIPVVETPASKEGVGRIYSIMSGEFKKTNSYIDGWVIARGVKKELVEGIKGLDGKPLRITKEVDDGYQMQKVAVDCVRNRINIYRNLIYDQYGAVDNGKSFNEPLRSSDFEEVIPNTVGEAISEMVCRLYK